MDTDRLAALVRRDRWSVLVNRYVVATLVLQTLSYAALVGFFEHGDATPLVELIRRIPAVVAVVLGVFAVPAVLLSIAVGIALESLLGVSPQTLGIGLVSGNDVPFLVVAYLLSVAVGRLVTRAAGS